MNETSASLVPGHPGPHAFNLLRNKLDRAYGSKPDVKILNRVDSLDVAYRTPYGEYCPHIVVMSQMTEDPMNLLLVEPIVGTVHNNLRRYFYILGLRWFT